jgi:hypothetical protein
MSKISYMNGGIEIDAGYADLSANTNSDGMIEIGIGAGYTNLGGYAEYQEFRLSRDEAIAFRDWLTGVLVAPTSPDAEPGR